MESIRDLVDHLGLVAAPTLAQCQELLAQNDETQYGMTKTQMVALVTLAAAVPIGLGLRKVCSLASSKDKRMEYLQGQLKKYDEELTAQKKVEGMLRRQVDQYVYDHKVVSDLYKSEEKSAKSALGKIALVQLELISSKRDNTCLKFENKTLKESNAELTAKQVTSDINAKEMEKTVLLAVDKIDDISKESSHWRQMSVNKDREIASLRARLRFMENEADENETDSTVLKVKLETMETQYEDLLAKIEKQANEYQCLECEKWSKQVESSKIEKDKWEAKYKDLKVSTKIGQNQVAKEVETLQKQIDHLTLQRMASFQKEFDMYNSLEGHLNQLEIHGHKQEKDIFNEQFINYLQCNPSFPPDQVVANAIVKDTLKENSQEMEMDEYELFKQTHFPDLVHAHENQDPDFDELDKIPGVCTPLKPVDELEDKDLGGRTKANAGKD